MTAVLTDGRTTETSVAAPPRRRPGGWGLWVAVAVAAVVTFAAALAPALPLAGPDESNFSALLQGPSWAHPFGTDEQGRDLLSRVVWGARVSILVGVTAVAIALLIGSALGLAAGYLRGWLDRGVGVLVNSILAFPAIILLMLVMTIFGFTLANVAISIGIIAVPTFARLMRANTIRFITSDFVLAARSSGAGAMRIVLREILPNAIPPVLVYSFTVVGVAIVAEGSLAFLGLSVPPPTPTWGGIVAAGRPYLAESPHVVAAPSVVLFLTVLSFNQIGEALRRWMGREEVAGR